MRDNKDRLIRDVVPNMPKAEVYYEARSDESSLKQLQQIWKHDAWFGRTFCLATPSQPTALCLALIRDNGLLRP